MKVVAYEESFGTFTFPEGFEASLKGLTIEQQMDRYRLTMNRLDTMTGWRERSTSRWHIKLQEVSDIQLIVKDDLLVGILLKDHNNRLVPCFADEGVCTYYDQENNGAGYKTRIENVYLMCAPEQTGNQGNVV